MKKTRSSRKSKQAPAETDTGLEQAGSPAEDTENSGDEIRAGAEIQALEDIPAASAEETADVSETTPVEPETVEAAEAAGAADEATAEEGISAPEPTPEDPAADFHAEADAGEEAEAEGEGVLAEEIPFSPFTLAQVCEAILFASQKPVTAKELRHLLKSAGETGDEVAKPFAKTKEPEIREALSGLAIDLQTRETTYEVRETAAGWQLVTRPHFAPWLRQLFPENRPTRLSAPALETLAIIAYRQPITRADIEAVRGVAVDGVMQTLLDRGLIRIGGRAEIPGRPLLYETTQFFMEHFGLRDLDELPNAGELRKVPLPTAAPAAEAPSEQQPAPLETPQEESLFPEEPAASAVEETVAESAEVVAAGEADLRAEAVEEPLPESEEPHSEEPPVA